MAQQLIGVYRVRVRYVEDGPSVSSFQYYGSGLDAYNTGRQVGIERGIQHPKVTVKYIGQILDKRGAA